MLKIEQLKELNEGDRKEAILKEVKDNKVEIIWLWFSDILGQIKGVGLTVKELETALNEGIGFDGSSVEGFARIHESDLMAKPDTLTFAWMPHNHNSKESPKAVRLFCDLTTPDNKPYDGDTRRILKKQLEKIKQKGYTFYIGSEIEYFYFTDMKNRTMFDQTGYFDASIMNQGSFLRRKAMLALEEVGIDCELEHHEVSPSQHEIDLKYSDALKMADQVLSTRYIIKEMARSEGAYATFMPKPVFGINGSGMHCHQSIFKDNKNLFFDSNDPYNLSQFAKNYIGGLLSHLKEITIVLNQWVNSYKRLVPGYEAPVYLSWGQKNRSALIRVPRVRVGKESSARIELRSPDPVCNPYLAFACMLCAGMEGIEKNVTIHAPIEENIFEMSCDERAKREIDTLPGNLYEAIMIAEKSEFLRNVLGDHIYYQLLENKRIEWDKYRIHVTDWELENYLPIL